MFDLTALAKTLNADSSVTVLFEKPADKFTVTVIPVLKNISESDDAVINTLQAVLTQPIRITVPEGEDINAFVNQQITGLLQAREPAVTQLSQYQQQIQEAQNQAKLAEQAEQAKKAKALADKATAAAEKAKKPATTTKASASAVAVAQAPVDADADADADDDNEDGETNESNEDVETAVTEDVALPSATNAVTNAPTSCDLFSNLGA